jgi:hypothetical protein
MVHRTLDEGAVEVLRRAGPQVSIAAAPLSPRLRGALIVLGAEVVADAAEVSARALLHQAGVGRKALAGCRKTLRTTRARGWKTRPQHDLRKHAWPHSEADHPHHARVA